MVMFLAAKGTFWLKNSSGSASPVPSVREVAAWIQNHYKRGQGHADDIHMIQDAVLKKLPLPYTGPSGFSN